MSSDSSRVARTNVLILCSVLLLVALFAGLLPNEDSRVTGAAIGIDSSFEIAVSEQEDNISEYIWHSIVGTTLGVSNLTGQQVWNLTLPGGSAVNQIAVDPSTNDSYWINDNSTLLKLNSTGAVLEHFIYGIAGGNGVAINYSTGNLYIGAIASDFFSANFSQYNSTGGNQWYRVKGSITPYEVAIGKNNTVFFSGTGLGSASVLFAFNLTGGDYWNVSPVDHFGTSGVGLGVDSNGSAYIIADDGNQDTGIIKYHGNGNLAWRRNLTNYKGYDLAVDINDSIFAVGDDGGAPASVIINKYNTAGKIVLNRSFNGTITDIACNTFCYTIGTNHTGGNTDNIVAKWYANNLSQVWNFTIGTTGIIAIAPPYTPAVVAADSTVPNVTFSNPSNGTNASNDFIAFNATIYEENPDTVLFEVSNGTKPFNITATNISGNWNANINMSTLIEDVHNITIFANDTTDNRNDTIFIQIKVDRTGPVMFLANTSFNTTDRTPDITYNFTDAAFNANCSLYFDGVWNISNDATANNTNTIITPSSGMLDGTYVTTINCTDPSNNTGNSSALIVLVDNAKPNVTFVGPVNGTNLSSGLVQFNATVVDATGVDTILFEFSNGTKPFNLTGNNITDVWNVTVNISAMIEDLHTVQLFVNDTAGNRNDSVNITVLVDRTGPSMTLANTSFNTSDTTPSFTFNFTDASVSSNCTLYIDGSHNASNSATANGTDTVLTVSDAMIDGTYISTINCTDGSGNTGNSSALTIIVDTVKPNVTFVGPLNGTNLSDGFVHFNATVVDATGVDTILFEFSNGTKPFNLTGNNITDVWNVTVNLSTLIEDLHNVTLFVNDSAGNRNDTVQIQVIIDRTGPNVTLTSASTSSTDTTPSITFNFTDLSVSANCSLYVNASFNASNEATANGTDTTLTTEVLAIGSYYATVNCTDGSGNTGNSSQFNITVSAAAAAESSDAAASTSDSGGGGSCSQGFSLGDGGCVRDVAPVEEVQEADQEREGTSRVDEREEEIEQHATDEEEERRALAGLATGISLRQIFTDFTSYWIIFIVAILVGVTITVSARHFRHTGTVPIETHHGIEVVEHQMVPTTQRQKIEIQPVIIRELGPSVEAIPQKGSVMKEPASIRMIRTHPEYISSVQQETIKQKEEQREQAQPSRARIITKIRPEPLPSLESLEMDVITLTSAVGKIITKDARERDQQEKKKEVIQAPQEMKEKPKEKMQTPNPLFEENQKDILTSLEQEIKRLDNAIERERRHDENA